jgi:cytochrome c oxidase cbb3-type subunit 1
MAINVWRTIRGEVSSDIAEQPASAAAPGLRADVAAVPAE